MANTKNSSVFRVKPPILSLSGLVFVSISILLSIYSYHPYGLYRQWKLQFHENDDGLDMWIKPSSDIFMKIYLFNVTNKDAFLEGREKLRVQEVGPYTWKQHQERKNPVFNHENATLTMNPTIEFEWIPSMSVGQEDDVLNLPNVAYLLFQSEVEQYPYLKKLTVKSFLGSNFSNPIPPQTVKEFLFGYESEVIKFGRTWMPHRISYDKLGLVDRTYDLKGDVVHIYTGENGNNRTGTLAAYNYKTVLPHWKAPCNEIDGASDAVKFPAEIQPNQSLAFYLKSMCRAVPMVQTENEKTIHGLRSVRYKFRKDALDNGHRNAENKCFCRDDVCLPDGLIDITDCSNGFNVALSYPHFYNGDPALLENVDGLKPVDDHESYFDINPDTGTLISTSVKIQTNAVLGDLSEVPDCKAFSNTIVPLMWMDVYVADLTPWAIICFIWFLRILPFLDRAGPFVLLFVGIGLIVCGGLCHRKTKAARRKSTDSSISKSQYANVATEEALISGGDDKESESSRRSLVDQ